MPDAAFTWLPDKRPPPPAWANRLAVARGTLSRASRADDPPADQMRRVLRLWRNQLARLRRPPKQGEPDIRWAVADSKRLPWLRNCPPYGVCCRSDKKLRMCGIQHFCPWCWGRRVVKKTYRLCVRGVKMAPDARVAVMRWVTDKPATEVLDAPAVQRSALEGMRTVVSHWKKAGALGGAATWTVTPGPGETWRTAVRLLVLLPPDQLPAELEDSVPPSSREFVKPDRRDLVKAVALFGRYPGALLTKEPAAVSALLSSRPKGRHFTTFGVLNAGTGIPKPKKGAVKTIRAKTISEGDGDGTLQFLEEQDQAGRDRGRPGGD